MNIIKCDICNQFHDESELERVTLTITKHKGCDVNKLFASGGVQSMSTVHSGERSTPVTVTDSALVDGGRQSKIGNIIADLKNQPVEINRIIGQ